jgi:tripartite-type tricarboxylate transporter receptor subunit TctC
MTGPTVMKLPRRQFLRIAAGTATLPAVTRIARAQTYPTRPVRIVVGFAAGGGPDIVARITGQWLSERLGQQFIIENKPGAGGNVATETVVHAPADGYTLLSVGPSAAANATLYDKLNFNFVRDTAPVAGIIRVPNVVVVNSSFPALTLSEFLAYAKANPGKVNLASAGTGSGTYLAGELFKLMTGINMQDVPYRGSTAALADLLGGQVQVMFDNMPAAIEQIRAGRLRALAVTTAARSEALPDVPALSEYVPGYEVSTWYGLSAPKGTPVDIIKRLNKEINAGLVDPKLKARFAELGGTAFPSTAADFGRFIADETEKWDKVIRAANIKAE